MQEVFKYNIFPRLNYIEVRNFVQCVKHTYFESTNYAFSVINIGDNELMNHLHYLKLEKKVGGYKNGDNIIKDIKDANLRFGVIYKEIYGKTLTELIESYTNLPSFVIKDKFFDEMVERCVDSIESYCFENNKYEIPVYPFSLALVSDNTDISDGGARELEYIKVDASEELLKYAKMFKSYHYLSLF